MTRQYELLQSDLQKLLNKCLSPSEEVEYSARLRKHVLELPESIRVLALGTTYLQDKIVPAVLVIREDEVFTIATTADSFKSCSAKSFAPKTNYRSLFQETGPDPSGIRTISIPNQTGQVFPSGSTSH